MAVMTLEKTDTTPDWQNVSLEQIKTIVNFYNLEALEKKDDFLVVRNISGYMEWIQLYNDGGLVMPLKTLLEKLELHSLNLDLRDKNK